MRRVLSKSFFNRPTEKVARELLGKFLVRRYPPTRKRSGLRHKVVGSTIIPRMITEVEVYDGFSDKASHASHGKTKRNTPMFGPAGCWYVYFTYGMHWMLNIVTREEGYPAAVLIRGVRGISGPARVTKFFRINKRLNSLPAVKKSGLWVEDRGFRVNFTSVKKGPRVGVDYAGQYWASRKWRLQMK